MLPPIIQGIVAAAKASSMESFVAMYPDIAKNTLAAKIANADVATIFIIFVMIRYPGEIN